jgi:hypothetical protein
MKQRIFFLIILALFAACSDQGDPLPPSGPVVPQDVTFSKSVQPIFNARCAIPGCHVQPDPKAFLDLTVDSSYVSLVNVPTRVFTPGVRVTPNDLNGSVLYLLVQSGLMPAMGPALSAAQVKTIRTWIEDGAPDN